MQIVTANTAKITVILDNGRRAEMDLSRPTGRGNYFGWWNDAMTSAGASLKANGVEAEEIVEAIYIGGREVMVYSAGDARDVLGLGA